MELQSPYLRAIQAIPGTVPGEKYRWLNSIAKSVAAGTKGQGDNAEAAAQVSNVPEPLVPLVRLEAANILRQYSGVVEALKSEDAVIINRAMSLRWFFRGENRDVISIEYFDKNLLPYVSLNTRVQLVKRLAINLRTAAEQKLAQEFYTYIAKKYGREEAEPLLAACAESFIYDLVKNDNVILSCHIVPILFVDYPDLIVRYLKLATTVVEVGSTSNKNIDLSDYSDFLPRLIKNHSDVFIELLENKNCTFGIKLSNKATETFLKSNVDALLGNPKLYTEMMPMKVIAAKLTKSQYKSMFAKLLPDKWFQFYYFKVSEYLQYFPEQERMTVVMELYSEVYGRSFLDNTEAIDENFMVMLPADERVRQARIKLEREPDWRKYRFYVVKAWRCYLPIEESIASIKSEIARTSTSDARTSLLCQLVYTCKVNDDKDALLEVLRYLTTRHKNEATNDLYEVMDELSKHFDLATLGVDHWAVLDDFIRFLHIKNAIAKRPEIPKKLLVAGVLFGLIHDLPVDEKIELILEINMTGWNEPWMILEKHPEYDRRCFEMFMELIPRKYPKDDEVWEERATLVRNIVVGMYDFNTRNAKASCKIEKLTVKSYPWLLEAVESVVKTTDADDKWKSTDIAAVLKIHEKDLYDAWIAEDENALVSVEKGEARVRLAKEPRHILDNWEEYLKLARSSHSQCAHSFVRATRWYQDIPIRFAESCLKVVGKERETSAIVTLGILLQGEEFARVTEPFLPKDSTIDVKSETAKFAYSIVSAIPQGMNLANPPVPLSFVLPFCDGDYLQLGLASLTNIGRRTSVAKIEPFAKSLVDRRVSVRKHGIRLFSLVASKDNLRAFLSELWATEKHRSIRAVIFGKIRDAFISDPDPDNWAVMRNCIADLKLDDDDSLRTLVNFDGVPSKYVGDYAKQLLETMEKLVASGMSETVAAGHIAIILNRVEMWINHVSEDFCEELLRKYFCSPRIHPTLRSAGISLATNGYLAAAGERLESRLTVLCSLFEELLRNHWNVPDPATPSFFPVNYMAHNFMRSLIYLKRDDSSARSRIMESVLKSFLAVLRPECDFEAYALLSYGIALRDAKTSEEIVAKMCEMLPLMVAAISPEIVVFLVDIVKDWLTVLIDTDQVERVMFDLTESLCEIGTDHACLLAMKVLMSITGHQFNARRVKIYKLLRKSKNLTVVSLVNQLINNRYG